MKNLLSITLMALFSAGAIAQECSLDLWKNQLRAHVMLPMIMGRLVTNSQG